MPTKKRKALTAKDVGLAPGVRLSSRYANTKKHYKTVSEDIIGFYVVDGGGRFPSRIAPIYRADIWLRDGKTNAVFTSHEVGPYYNEEDLEDPETTAVGNDLARAASTLLGALQRHGHRRWERKKKR